MLQWMLNNHKTNWNLILFHALWAYRTFVKTATEFTPFHLAFVEEAVLLIECEIPSLYVAIELLPETKPLEK